MNVRDPSSNDLVSGADPARLLSPSKYDLLLAVVPALLVAGAVAGTRLALPPSVGTGLGSLLAALLVGYGLFVEPPMGGRGA
ncbi:hypothetical protein [Halobaculum gomorrense]|uniref:Uncharacterized protein n=1 Tax=Halobaculum gomorrense TaxID=43928 RepID=A0A1M5M000_9EURY|nr:hypothetical protein [Halobaculum gomorrense]SHG70556.1 hypothetical protein SAMN05443636_0835 [Halobaculum gomorrense]